MVSTTFLIVCFIKLVVAASLLIFYIVQLVSLPTAPPPQPDPDSVSCTPDQVLQAWIENVPNRAACPAFTNNYIISSDSIQMFEKNFKVDSTTDCCWYSDLPQQRAYFPNPWICISRTDGSSFSLTELNEKPYAFDNETTTFLVPPCEGSTDCIGLIRFDQDPTTLVASYKIFLFEGSQSNLTSTNFAQKTSCPDFQEATFEEIVFKIGPDCADLMSVEIAGTPVVQRIPGTSEYQFLCPQDDLPTFVIDVVQLFTIDSKRFFPIAGANPVLSQSAAQNSSS